MNSKKKEARVLVIVSLFWVGIIYGIALLTTLCGIELQNSFLHALLFTGEGLIGALFWSGVRKNQEEALEKRNVLTWFILLAVVFGLAVYLWPLEKRLPGGLLVAVDENGDNKYYDKEKIVLKEEFQWDTEHDIKLLEGQLGYKFQLDKKTGSNSKRYISDSMPERCVGIEEYPTYNSRKATIIYYSSEKIRTTTGELYYDSDNKFPFRIFFCTEDGRRVAQASHFVPGIKKFDHDEFSVDEEYLVGVSVRDDKNKEIVLRYADKESSLNSEGKEIRIKMD